MKLQPQEGAEGTKRITSPLRLLRLFCGQKISSRMTSPIAQLFFGTVLVMLPLRPALAADIRHVVVYHEPGKFAGWPANAGIWSWGDEILVGFHAGFFVKSRAAAV